MVRSSGNCLWEQVTDELVDFIKQSDLQDGDKFFSADEISERYGVSNITSRRVLSELAERNMIEKARGKGCIVKKSSGIDTVHIMVHDKEEVLPMHFSHVQAGLYKGIMQGCAEIGCESKIITLNFIEKACESMKLNLLLIQNFPRHRPDMTDIISTHPNINCVCCHALEPIEGVSTVRADLWTAAYKAVSHLVKKGHKRIAFVGGGSPQWSASRFDGYYHVLKENNLVFDSRFVKSVEMEYEDHVNAINELMAQENPPTAIFTVSDKNALMIFDYCKEKNIRVPDDIAVVAIDNLTDGEVSNPPLTSVDSKWAEEGRLSVNLLAKQLPKNKVRDILVEPELVIRRSA
jgi:DNA-binding LacI/PurR family transcriptional regulator